MAEKENKVCGRYSTFSSLGLEVMMEFYAINGFPTKAERKIMCEFVGETDRRVQQWFKRRRKADQKRGKEVMRGNPSGLLSELKKVRSTFQLRPTSKALVEEGPKGDNTTEKTLHGGPQEDKKMIRVTKKEPGLTPFVWPHPRDLPLFFGVPSMDCVPYAFPALKSTIRTTPTKTPTKEARKSQFTPALLESSCAKSNIRIRDPFEEDPTPTKKRRKLSNDAMRASVDTMMEDILGGTSHLLPHIDSFLWSKEGPRFT